MPWGNKDKLKKTLQNEGFEEIRILRMEFEFELQSLKIYGFKEQSTFFKANRGIYYNLSIWSYFM